MIIFFGEHKLMIINHPPVRSPLASNQILSYAMYMVGWVGFPPFVTPIYYRTNLK